MKSKCPLNLPGAKDKPALQPGKKVSGRLGRRPVVVSRIDKRSWIAVAITGFGAVLLRYLRTVRERAWSRE